jgi:hypothetical protein
VQSVTNAVAVTIDIPSLTGRLSPHSDTGISPNDGVTRINTPMFVGTATPGSVIQVYALRSGETGAGTVIAGNVADGAGVWQAGVVNTVLADGSYAVVAKVIGSSGEVLAETTIGSLVIDTVAPVITGMNFDRFNGTLGVTYQDNLSGMDLPSVLNGANYQFKANQVVRRVPVPRTILPTSITQTSGPKSIDPVNATVVLNGGANLRGGNYVVSILSGGVEDVAGNALAGNFYGTFPTGNGSAAADFTAQVTSYATSTFAPIPIRDGFAKPPTTQPSMVSRPGMMAAARARAMQAAQAVRGAAIHVPTLASRTNQVHDSAISSLSTEIGNQSFRRRGHR